ncbi:MAG: DUF4331 domain-containing protein [Pseudomonadota bacterium]|nr:DUF4331 domain-containing protein [Pseudomonadota bacterium]
MLSTLALLALPALASSHREAPAISLDPAADITDFYAFRDPNDTSKVVFILNVNPLEAPGGGPNFHRFDDNVLYSINIDNEGDGEEDIVFNVQFETTYSAVDAFGLETFIYNIGSVADPANVYQKQSYTVTRVDDGVSSVVLSGGSTAPINVGTQSGSSSYNPGGSTPGAITTANIETSGSYSFFAGPRQEGFYVDLERTFDLLNVANLDGTANQNTLLGYNVHSIAISLPITSITKDGLAATAANQNHVVSSWGTTSRRAVTVRRSTGVDNAYRGGWVQVARLGNPLVNEVVLPVQQKDIFNASHPRDDIQFLSYAQNSVLGAYMNVVLGTTCPTSFDAGLGIGGREDLLLAFLTGHPDLGVLPAGFSLGGAIPGESGKVFGAFEALRINLEGTGFGQWPDGRYVSDDVVDVALGAVCGGLAGSGEGFAVVDGVDSTGLHYLDSFPFLGDPWAGDDHPNGGHDELGGY